jgi:hypothetical protein
MRLKPEQLIIMKKFYSISGHGLDKGDGILHQQD